MSEAVVTKTDAVPGMRLETTKLIAKLKEGQVGDVLSDEQLTTLCGKDTSVMGDGYCYLGSAMRHVLNNFRVVWERIKGAGVIKCLSWSEVETSADGDRKSIHRRSRRAVTKLKTVDLSDVPEDGRPNFLTKAAQLGTLAAMSSTGMQKKLEARNVAEPLDLKKMLENLSKT